jgi:hypothetical protein
MTAKLSSVSVRVDEILMVVVRAMGRDGASKVDG